MRFSTARVGYKEYIEKKCTKTVQREESLEEEILVNENRLSVLIGKLSMNSKNDDPEEMDREYYKVLKKSQELKNT